MFRHTTRSPARHRLLRRLVVPVLVLGLVAGGFMAGLRSGVQKDMAYFWVKEAKIQVSHVWHQWRERLSGGADVSKLKEHDEIKVFTANDFSLELMHLTRYGTTEKTAGFVSSDAEMPVKFEQASLQDWWTQEQWETFVDGAKPTLLRGGGLKQIFRHDQQTLALITLEGDNRCRFAALINVTARKEVFRAPCLPPVDELDFSSIGGAWTPVSGGILMSLGTPSDDPRVARLAQDAASPYGKVLFFKDERLKRGASQPSDFSIHSLGHRNPQGMVDINHRLYSIDHGPKGGDEINRLEEGANYGWPLYSLGSSYQGKPHDPQGPSDRFRAPLSAFVPSVAPSDITACPTALAQRYAPLNCVLITTLRGMSLIIGLIDEQDRVLSLERIPVDMRLREFVRLADDRIAVATDGYGVFEIAIADMAVRH